MLVSDVLTALSHRIGENSIPNSNSELSRRVSFIAQAQRAVIGHMPFWFTETSTTLSSTAGTQSYALPARFRQAIEVRIDGKLYLAARQDEYFEQDNATYNISPNSFVIYGGNIIFSPVPQVTGTNNITIKYYEYPASITAQTDTIVIPETFSDVLTSYAYMKFWAWMGDKGRSDIGLAEYNEQLRLLVAEHNSYMVGAKQSQVRAYEYV